MCAAVGSASSVHGSFYDVLDYLTSGLSTDETVRDFPEPTEQYVRAAGSFAAMPAANTR